MNTIDEQALLERIRQSDTAAFKTLHDLYYQPLYTLALKKLGDADDAYDLLQEMFLELWEKRASFFISNALYNYLRNRLWFKLAGYFRKKGFHEKHLHAFARYITEASAPDEPIELEKQEMEKQYDLLLARVDAAIAKMPSRMREAFVLSRSGDYSTSQVAAQMGVSQKTVNNQLTMAFERIRRALSDQELSLMSILFLIWLTKN